MYFSSSGLIEIKNKMKKINLRFTFRVAALLCIKLPQRKRLIYQIPFDGEWRWLFKLMHFIIQCVSQCSHMYEYGEYIVFVGEHKIIYFERIIFLCQKEPFMRKGYTWSVWESFAHRKYKFVLVQLCRNAVWFINRI